jgi:hypothetical protein
MDTHGVWACGWNGVKILFLATYNYTQTLATMIKNFQRNDLVMLKD